MISKKAQRQRRARRGRRKMKELGVVRLSVNRTPRHMYAQLFSPDGRSVLTQASTLEKDICDGPTGNVESAQKIGQLIAQRALEQGINKVAFDRSGFKYHGRVKALADSAREAGLRF